MEFFTVVGMLAVAYVGYLFFKPSPKKAPEVAHAEYMSAVLSAAVQLGLTAEEVMSDPRFEPRAKEASRSFKAAEFMYMVAVGIQTKRQVREQTPYPNDLHAMLLTGKEWVGTNVISSDIFELTMKSTQAELVRHGLSI